MGDLKQDRRAATSAGALERPAGTSWPAASPYSRAVGGVDPSILTAATGAGIMFSSKIVAYGLRFVTGIILARRLGSQQLGLYGLSLTTATMVSGYAMLGLNDALVRYVSLYASRKDDGGLLGALHIGIVLPMGLSLLGAVGLFLLADPIAEGLFHEPELAPLLRIGCFVLLFSTLSQLLAAATRGFKTMQYTAISRMVSLPTLRLVLVIGLGVSVGLTAARALGAYAAAVAVSGVMLLFFLDRLFSLRRPLKRARRNWREMLAFSLPVYLSGRLSASEGNLRTLLLGALATTADVGSLAVASQVNTLGSVFHASLTTSSAPIVAELHDRRAWQRLKVVYQTVTKWTFTVNLPFFLLVLLFPDELLSIFGASFAGAAVALAILAWANLVNTGTGICGVVIDMTGHTYLKLLNSAAALILSIGLSLLLIPRWGLTGAATTALAVAASLNLLRLVEVFLLFRLLPYDRSFTKPVLAGLVAALVGWGLDRVLALTQDLFRLAICAAALFVAYGGVLLLVGLSREDRAVVASFYRRIPGQRHAAATDVGSQREEL